MRNLLCSLVLLLLGIAQPIRIHAQELDGQGLQELFDLYADKQYSIVQVKLEHLGFELTESTPDYTLNGQTHSGVFTMLRAKEHATKVYRDMGMQQVDRFFFKTEATQSQQEANISFDYSDNTFAEPIFNYFTSLWAADIQPNTLGFCSGGTKCHFFRRAWSNQGVTFDLTFNDKPVSLGNSSPEVNRSVHGSYIYTKRPRQVKILKSVARKATHKK